MTSNNHTKFIFKQIILIGVTFTLTLALLEGLLRVKHRPGLVEITNPDGIRVWQPSSNTNIQTEDGSFIRVQINREGFASRDVPAASEPNTTRLAFLGNSFTQGFQVDGDLKFTSILERMLNASSSGRKYEVMNFAHDSNSIAEDIIIYKRYVKKYHPDFIFLVYAAEANLHRDWDFFPQADYILNTPGADIDPNKLLGTPLPEPPGSWRHRFLIRSRIVQSLLELVLKNQTLSDWGVRLGVLRSVPLKPNAPASFDRPAWFLEPTDESKKIIAFSAQTAQKLARTVEKDGVKFVLVIIPSHYQADNQASSQLLSSGNAYDFDLPNEIIKREAKTNILDLSDVFRRGINLERRPLFFYHLTADGHRLVADEIFRYLKVGVGRNF